MKRQISRNLLISKQQLKGTLKFPQLPDAYPTPIMITDTQGNIYYVNPAWEQLTGYTYNEVKGGNPRMVSSGKTPPKIYDLLWKNLQEGNSFTTEDMINKTKNGAEYRIHSTFFPIKKNGENLFFVQLIDDITERKKLETQLKESEKLYKDLVNNASDGILLLDLSAVIVDANRAICSMLGYSRAELIGEKIQKISDAKDSSKTTFLIRELRAGKSVLTECKFIHKNGTKIYVELNSKIIHENKIEAIVRNVTQKKILDKQKDSFLGIVAHELKTPITTIKASAQLMNMKLKKTNTKELFGLTKMIDEQSSRLTGLVNDLLNIEKIESGKFPILKKEHDINKTINKIIVSFQNTFRFNISTDGKLPKRIIYDENRISQVIINLLTNAIKYSPTSDKIIIHLQQEKRCARIGIQDFGFGINKADRQKIFQLFYRTKDKEESKIPGFGLGLYIANEIIKKHKGKIWVRSSKGKGSTFYFTLPFAV
jgi:PAS domain S-box-containing protein